MSSSASHHHDLLQHEVDPLLLEPYRYIDSIPGKDVRGKLMDCFQLWLKVPCEVMHTIKDIVAELHNASLLIDDIEDNSQLRRGVPVAHHIFGMPSVINCANYVYFLALNKCHSLQNEQATTVFVQELLRLHRGQGRDILWRDTGTCPTEDEYNSMVIDKTGGLFRLAVGLMQAFSTTHSTDFTSLLNNLALYFQIRDDLINVADMEYMKSKSFCEDLTEGKFSFPILHCIRQDPKDTRLSSILKQRTSDDQVKRYAQTILRDAGSLTYTREKCTNLKNDILQQILILGGNRPLETLIQLLDVQLEKLDPSIVPSQLVPSSPSSTTTSNEPQQNPQTSSNISPSTSWRIDST